MVCLHVLLETVPAHLCVLPIAANLVLTDLAFFSQSGRSVRERSFLSKTGPREKLKFGQEQITVT